MGNEVDVFKEKYLFNDETEELPTVRIKRVVLDNFKSVKHGEIVFNCGKQFIPYGTKSDILGVYGQNGSGKTSLIEALAILERLMNGSRIPDVYADCIAVGSNSADLLFAFDLQYPNGEIRELVYSFSMEKLPLTKEEIADRYKDAPADYDIPEDGFRVRIFNERIRMDRKNTEERMIMQDIIDTSADSIPFGPATKFVDLAGKNPKTLVELEVSKKSASDLSRSFIFSKKTLQILKETGLYSVYFQTLLEMRYFASLYFFVVDTKSSGFIRLNLMLPVYTQAGVIEVDVRRPETLSDSTLDAFINDIAKMSGVLAQLVPGLTLGVKKVSETITRSGEHGNVVMLMAYRDGIEIPLRDESDGVRKIISVLSLLTAAYNSQSFTLAIDEFDAGIFEYLLGEILQIMESTGKGQFIFTSHNLRPLEVLDKKHIVFTTTNPQNRYYRLKSVGKTNNLRDTYFREILLNEQDEPMYNKTKRFKIESALRRAGDGR